MAINPNASATLTAADVTRLLKDNSPESREATARKITENYSSKGFVETEKKIAEDIFRQLAKDAEVRIRKLLSEELAVNEDIPKDVALTLANDISDIVSTPILKFSSLLSSDDLVKIVMGGNESKQIAIASRVRVDEKVSSAIAEVGKEKAVEALVGNEGAAINEKSFNKVIDRFGDSAEVQKKIAMRDEIPTSIAERLLDRVSEDLKNHIVTKHKVNAKKVEAIVNQSREKATINVTGRVSDEETQGIVMGLKRQDKLTPSIILRALCSGETVFFENSIALLTNLPVGNIRRLIYDTGPLGLPALYEKAGLPIKMFPAARIAVDLIKETDYKGGDSEIQEAFSRMVVGRLMDQLRDVIDEPIPDDADIETLLELMED